MTTTGMQRKPGVQVRLAAGSPKASRHSHLNPGFKVVWHASSWRRMHLFHVHASRAITLRIGMRRVIDLHAMRHDCRAIARLRRNNCARSRAREFPQRSASPPPNRSRDTCCRCHSCRHRVRRRLLGDGWRNRVACLAIALAAGADAIACPCSSRRSTCASRRGGRGEALVTNRYGIPEPDVAASALLDAADMAHGRRAAGRLRRAMAIAWAWAAAGTIAASRSATQCRSRAAAAVAGRRRLRHAAGRRARRGTLGRGAGCGVHRTRNALPDATRCTHEPTQALLVDEDRTRRLLDRRSANASAPNRGPACATTRRATSCASMQVGDGVLFYHSSTEIPGIYGHRGSRERAPIRIRPSSTGNPSTSIRRPPASNRAGTLVDVALRAQAQAADPARTTIRGHADALGEDFALIRKGSAAVGAAGDGRAMEIAAVAGITRNRRT